MAKGRKGAGRAGAGTPAATRILTRNGRVCGVETDRGVIATEKVLLAGGMWTSRFAAAHGVTVPLHATEHFYIVTEPLARVCRAMCPA
jgi:glycine/D-amino acid oxidase-like deaminating enzyme